MGDPTSTPSSMMSRRAQYEALLPAFEWKTSRYEALNERANIYIAIVSGVAVATGLNLDNLKRLFGVSPASLVLGEICLAGLLVSLVTLVISLRIRTYHTICNAESLTASIEENQYSEEDVYTLLLAGLVEATTHNRIQDDGKAFWLELSGMILTVTLGGFFISAFFLF